MSIRNRELSQFGSFIYIDDATKSVGIATTATPYVGIGTTNAQYKLHVVGNTNLDGNTSVTGILSATSYYLNGNPLVNAEVSSWQTSGSDAYRLTGNVGIGSSVPKTKLEVIGNINSSGIVSASNFISTVTSGTSPLTISSQTLVTNLNSDFLRGKVLGGTNTGDIVSVDGTQTLSNKSINLSNNTLTGTTAQFNTALSDDNFATLSGSETLTNKTLTNPVISAISNSGTQTIPTGTGTLVSTNSIGVITSDMIANLSIKDEDVNASAAIAISKLAASTISGVSLGSNLNNLTAGTYVSYDSGSTYNGSASRTITIKASSSNADPTNFPIVARNASGDFSAGSISCSNLTAAFTVTGQDINSTSDENLKTNIKTVENSLETINQLRGVTFDWKNNGKPSIGVIAQELEKVLPQLVTTGENKSVNYNGIIGVLVEAVKELSQEVQELKAQLNK